MGTSPEFASRAEAAEAVRAGLGYLAALDPAQLPACEQAELLQLLEQAHALETAARTGVLGGFTTAQGYHEDGDYSPRSWLINHTGITKGAATAHTRWVKRADAHPRVAAALAATQISESVARTVCDWTDNLPADCQDTADAILIAAALSGASLADLARLAAEIYVRSRPPDPDGSDDGFDDRSVRLETTFEGAGVLGGDLTPECAAVVTAVLDALSAPAGAGDLRTYGQRYHDALQDAMQRLLGAGLLPERAGQPVRGWVHMSLAELLALDGERCPARPVGHRGPGPVGRARAAASVGRSDGAAWLDGAAAAAVACDALISPVVTGEVDPAALDGLVRLCVELARLGPGTGPDGADPHDADPDRADPDGGDLGGADPDDTNRATQTRATRTRATRTGSLPPRPPRRGPWPGRRSNGPSSARPSSSCPGRAGSPASCAATSSAPRWPGPACRWTSATATPSPPPSATPSPCATSTAGGPAAAPSPP